jgi:hypothetical protein
MNSETAPPPGNSAASAALPPPPRRRWLTLLLAGVLFASGVVVGGAGALWTVRQRALQLVRHPDHAPQQISARLQKRLGLSDEQTVRVREVLKRRQGELLKIRRQAQPQVERQLDLLQAEVAAELDEQQAERWRADLARVRGLWLPPVPPDPVP